MPVTRAPNIAGLAVGSSRRIFPLRSHLVSPQALCIVPCKLRTTRTPGTHAGPLESTLIDRLHKYALASPDLDETISDEIISPDLDETIGPAKKHAKCAKTGSRTKGKPQKSSTRRKKPHKTNKKTKRGTKKMRTRTTRKKSYKAKSATNSDGSSTMPPAD